MGDHPEVDGIWIIEEIFCFSNIKFYLFQDGCRHPCIHAYMHACMHACIHTYIHTYTYTYISKHIHTHTNLHCTTLHCTALHYTTVHYTFPIIYTLQITHYTLRITHCTLHITHYTLHITHTHTRAHTHTHTHTQLMVASHSKTLHPQPSFEENLPDGQGIKSPSPPKERQPPSNLRPFMNPCMASVSFRLVLQGILTVDHIDPFGSEPTVRRLLRYPPPYHPHPKTGPKEGEWYRRGYLRIPSSDRSFELALYQPKRSPKPLLRAP